MADPKYMDVPAPYTWKGQQENWNYLPWDAPVWPYPWRLNAQLMGGWSGFGGVWENVPDMWVALVFAAVWFFVRSMSKKVIFPPVARALGVNAKKKRTIDKFSYNMWLLIFYLSSSIFGYFIALEGEKFFAFPIDLEAGLAMFNYHPVPIKPKIHWYYMYQLGFYIAELYAIFVEPKRSDFVEYLIHHVVTIVLIGLSYFTHEHRVGAYVILMHDVPDVCLCFAKMFFYTGAEHLSNASFAFFVGSFAFLRLYCLPKVTHALFYLSPQVHPATTGYWILAFLLGVVLQALHVFWFAMILKLIVKIVSTGNPGDPRSDDEEEMSEAHPTKKRQPRSNRTAENSTEAPDAKAVPHASQ